MEDKLMYNKGQSKYLTSLIRNGYEFVNSEKLKDFTEIKDIQNGCKHYEYKNYKFIELCFDEKVLYGYSWFNQPRYSTYTFASRIYGCFELNLMFTEQQYIYAGCDKDTQIRRELLKK